jgi:hypothetical protein
LWVENAKNKDQHLVKRGFNQRPPRNDDEKRLITYLIAKWDWDSIDVNQRKQSNVFNLGNARIDIQEPTWYTGIDGVTRRYFNVQVQIGSGSGTTVATVQVPGGVNVSSRQIRDAFNRSLERGANVIITPGRRYSFDRPQQFHYGTWMYIGITASGDSFLL